MNGEKMNINKTVFFLIVVVGILSAGVETQKSVVSNPSINDICRIPETNKYVLVSDSGWVYFCDRYNLNEAESIRITTDFVLTGVCFPDSLIGYVVGYKRDEPNKSKGAIWKMINKSVSWIRLPQIPSFPLPTRFLDVEAVNQYVVWVTCENDYELRTIDGGVNWEVKSKKY
jgi:hypothetical protein